MSCSDDSSDIEDESDEACAEGSSSGLTRPTRLTGHEGPLGGGPLEADPRVQAMMTQMAAVATTAINKALSKHSESESKHSEPKLGSHPTSCKHLLPICPRLRSPWLSRDTHLTIFYLYLVLITYCRMRTDTFGQVEEPPELTVPGGEPGAGRGDPAAGFRKG